MTVGTYREDMLYCTTGTFSESRNRNNRWNRIIRRSAEPEMEGLERTGECFEEPEDSVPVASLHLLS